MIRTIIEKCGGAKAIAEHSTKSGRHLAAKTVYSWVDNGIPEWHWPVIRELGGYTADDLHVANERLRASRTFQKAQVAVA